MCRVRILTGVVTLVAATACYASTTEIDQVAQRFSRTSVSLAVGDVLTFVNHDDVRHNIRIIDADGNELDKGLQDPGQTITAKFDKAGRFTARCAIYQKMKMVIEVK